MVIGEGRVRKRYGGGSTAKTKEGRKGQFVATE